jgi:hypothetical protein
VAAEVKGAAVETKNDALDILEGCRVYAQVKTDTVVAHASGAAGLVDDLAVGARNRAAAAINGLVSLGGALATKAANAAAEAGDRYDARVEETRNLRAARRAAP